MNATPTIEQSADGTFTIRNLEVFRAGDYKDKGAYTADDLAQMAASYAPEKHEAPLTVDHAQEGPAFGWVSRVYAQGKSLYADIAKVPAEMADAIKSGHWRKRSAEIYRNFDGGKKYLKAVTLLGAAAPHVKGMADFKFAETHGESVRIACFAYGGEMEDFPMPDGANVGVLVKQTECDRMLGHSHYVVLDAQGNGFTSAPCYYEDGEMECVEEGEDGFHQHLVVGGKIQPAEVVGVVPAHAHGFYYNVAPMSEVATNPTEAADMAATDTPAADVAKFAAVQSELEAAKAKLAAYETERAVKQFDDAFNAALKDGGRVLPATRETLLAVFLSLPESDSVVAFGEKSATVSRQRFLSTFADMPKRLDAKPIAADAPVQSFAAPTDKDDPTAARMALDAEVKKFMEAREAAGTPITYTDALRAVESKTAKKGA